MTQLLDQPATHVLLYNSQLYHQIFETAYLCSVGPINMQMKFPEYHILKNCQAICIQHTHQHVSLLGMYSKLAILQAKNAL